MSLTPTRYDNLPLSELDRDPNQPIYAPSQEDGVDSRRGNRTPNPTDGLERKWIGYGLAVLVTAGVTVWGINKTSIGQIEPNSTPDYPAMSANAHNAAVEYKHLGHFGNP